jgi:hypothetical protein
MADNRLLDFLRTEGIGLGLIGILVFVFGIGVVVLSQALGIPSFSYSDVANLIVAIVAVSSLYIAWRELVRKTEHNITVHFDYEFPKGDDVRERMFLKLTNSGTNIITPVNIWYSEVRREDDSYLFIRDMLNFDEDGLSPGDTATIEIGDDVILMAVETVNIRDWKGSVQTIEEIKPPMQRQIHLVDSGGKSEVKLQKIFEKFLEYQRLNGLFISAEELRSSTTDEIFEKHFPDEQLEASTT